MRRNLQSEIMAWGADLGLKEPGKPDTEFELPKEITKMSLDELGVLYWECGRWVDYVKTQLTKVETQIGVLKGEERKLWARLWNLGNNSVKKTGRGVTGGKEALEAFVLSDKDYASLMDELELERGKKNYAEALYESLRRGANQISREYARRNIKIASAFTPDQPDGWPDERV